MGLFTRDLNSLVQPLTQQYLDSADDGLGKSLLILAVVPVHNLALRHSPSLCRVDTER